MCYFSNALRYPCETIDTICHAMNDPKFDHIDLIVGTGMSGILMLVPVSVQFGVPCCAVRKMEDTKNSTDNGGSHSSSIIEMFLPPLHRVYRYVIIDDLIDSGGTIGRIIDTMAENFDDIQCVGIILYQHFSSDEGDLCRDIPVAHLGADIKELAAFEPTGWTYE